jgi:diaminopimelate epimerase
MRFTKLQALGNDFIVVPPGERPAAATAAGLALRVCERRTGAGADGLILLDAPADEPGVWAFRVFNCDGSEAGISGNGLRAAAGCLLHRGLARPGRLVFRTAVGERSCDIKVNGPGSYEVLLFFPEPAFRSDLIPFEDGTPHERVFDHPITVGGRALRITCVSVGNPHCGAFYDEFPPVAELLELGAAVENSRFFPERTNVEFIRVLGRDEIEVVFWERGVGRTMASGTGACAAAVAAMVNGRTAEKVRVRTELGGLTVEWRPGSGIRQLGPVEVVYDGELPA